MPLARNPELLMISIKPTFWKLSNVIWAVFICAFCLCPLALQSPTASSSLAGLGTFVGLAVLCWLMVRPIRLARLRLGEFTPGSLAHRVGQSALALTR